MPQVGTAPGAYLISNTGALKCSFATAVPDGGVFSSPALEELDLGGAGQLEIAFGALDFKIRVLSHNCTLKYQVTLSDTPWSSPALADLDGDSNLEAVSNAVQKVEAAAPQGWVYAVDGNGATLPG